MKHRRCGGEDRLRLAAGIHHKRRAKREVRARRIEELTAIRDVEAAKVVIGEGARLDELHADVTGIN